MRKALATVAPPANLRRGSWLRRLAIAATLAAGCGDPLVVELGAAKAPTIAPANAGAHSGGGAATGSAAAAHPSVDPGATPTAVSGVPCLLVRADAPATATDAPYALPVVATGACATAKLRVENCGALPLSGLQWRRLDAAGGQGAIAAAEPDAAIEGISAAWVLAPGSWRPLTARVCPQTAGAYAVHFAFDAAAPTAAKPGPTSASAATTPPASLEAKLAFAGQASVGCLVPKLTLPSSATPGQPVAFSVAASQSPTGAAVTATWRLLPPDPFVVANALPDSPQASFVPTLAGVHRVCAEVRDAAGAKGCAEVCSEIDVVPSEALRVELTWLAPGANAAAGGGPEAGIDLDLHLAMTPLDGADRDCDGQPDPWFGALWDLWWGQSSQAWGAAGSADDGLLSSDDGGSPGVEIAVVDAPAGTTALPQTYTIGVHAFDDHGHGAAQARLRIWIAGALAAELGPQPLEPLTLWTAARVRWPNVVTGADGPPLLVCQQSGDPCAGGKRWVQAGAACLSACYAPPGGQAPQHATPAACGLQ